MLSDRIVQLSASALAFTGAAVLILSPGQPAAPTSYASYTSRASTTTSSSSYSVTNYDADILTARQNLDRYYGDRFKNNYTAPGVSWINEAGGTATGCGTLSASEGPKQAAFYCPRDKVVYLDYGFLQAINRDYGYEGVLQVMGHEYGHHVQNLNTQPSYTAPTNLHKAEEWQADCYSGAFMHWMSSVLPNQSYSGLWNQVYNFGDSGTDSPSGYSHGTGAQRAAWFAQGWNAPAATAANTCYAATY